MESLPVLVIAVVVAVLLFGAARRVGWLALLGFGGNDDERQSDWRDDPARAIGTIDGRGAAEDRDERVDDAGGVADDRDDETEGDGGNDGDGGDGDGGGDGGSDD